MKEAGVQRLVSLSALGAAESRKTLPLWVRFIVSYIVFPTILGRSMVDTEVQEKVVHESGLDWTLVRPPNLTNKPAAGSYKHGFKDCKDLSSRYLELMWPLSCWTKFLFRIATCKKLLESRIDSVEF